VLRQTITFTIAPCPDHGDRTITNSTEITIADPFPQRTGLAQLPQLVFSSSPLRICTADDLGALWTSSAIPLLGDGIFPELAPRKQYLGRRRDVAIPAASILAYVRHHLRYGTRPAPSRLLGTEVAARRACVETAPSGVCRCP